MFELHSVLNVPETESSTIRLLHPSFRDFLLDPKRCSNPSCMEVGKLEIEGSVTAFPLDVMMRQHPKQCPSRHLTTAVFSIINCVWITKKAVLMKCKHICNKRLSTGIRFIPLYRSQRTVIF
jgi:hypothetical protein